MRLGGGSKVDVERIVRDGRRVRIEFPAGSRFEGQTVIERPDGRFVIDPARREIRRLPARAVEGQRRLGRYVRLVRDGTLTLTGGDGGRVAGMPTRRLVLARAGRPILALSIEPRAAVVLRRESLDDSERGEGPAAAYVFTSFSPRAKIDPANFAIPKTDFRLVSPVDDLRALAGRERIAVEVLPETSGYRLEGARVRKTSAGTILAAFYSGGGKRLTLFASNGELPELPGRGTGNAGRLADVALYRWRVGTTSYGLLGEESPARLRSLAALLGAR